MIWCAINLHHAVPTYKGSKQSGWKCYICGVPTDKPFREVRDKLMRVTRYAKSSHKEKGSI